MWMGIGVGGVSAGNEVIKARGNRADGKGAGLCMGMMEGEFRGSLHARQVRAAMGDRSDRLEA